jgi:hypothetical protein
MSKIIPTILPLFLVGALISGCGNGLEQKVAALEQEIAALRQKEAATDSALKETTVKLKDSEERLSSARYNLILVVGGVEQVKFAAARLRFIRNQQDLVSASQNITNNISMLEFPIMELQNAVR